MNDGRMHSKSRLIITWIIVAAIWASAFAAWGLGGVLVFGMGLFIGIATEQVRWPLKPWQVEVEANPPGWPWWRRATPSGTGPPDPPSPPPMADTGMADTGKYGRHLREVVDRRSDEWMAGYEQGGRDALARIFGPEREVEPEQDCWEFEDAAKLFYAEVQVNNPDGPWPAMVRLVQIEEGQVLPPDARELARILTAAADLADKRNYWDATDA